jgi:hypothetical protein
MLKSKLFLLVLLAIVVTGPASGELDSLPDYDFSVAWRSYEGPEFLTLMITPAGTGQFFSQARLPDGTIADGTINLRLVDWGGVPVNGYPLEDIWLQDLSSPLKFCGIFELWPDLDTDINGETLWFNRPRGGGYTVGNLQVYVNGNPLLGPPLPLQINSPDINADLRVNLSDLTPFTEDYFGTYHFRSDLHHDGVINLSDVTILAEWMGRGCNSN